MMRAADPVLDAQYYYDECEREYKRYIKGNATCLICGKTIVDACCCVLDPNNKMESSVCNDCVSEQLRNMMKGKPVDSVIVEWCEEELGLILQADTPHDENKEEVA